MSYGLHEELTLNPEWEDYIYLANPQIDEFGVDSQYVFKFPNNYGASVIKSSYSYGGMDDLWELGLIFWVEEDEWHLIYEDEFEDVIGYLTDEEVNDYLTVIFEK